MTDPQRELAPHIREAICWRLMSELVRRHPSRFWVMTSTHSLGSEQAFLMDLTDATQSRWRAIFGMSGTFAEPTVVPGPPLRWDRATDGSDPHEWLLEFERGMGLDPPTGQRLPPSTPASLGVRLIATLLATKIGDRRPWIAGGSHRWSSTQETDALAMIPRDATWMGTTSRPHPIVPLFVGPWPDGPVAAVAPSGDVWTRHGDHVSLEMLHTPSGSMTALLAEALPRDLT